MRKKATASCRGGECPGHRPRHRWVGWVFPLAGLSALIWFLVRVVPKPSRAAYPCQRVAMPLTSGFVLWLVGVTGSVAASPRLKRLLRESRAVLACLGLVTIAVIGVAELEVQRRTAVAIERRLKQAEFPMVKDLSSYRFGDVPKLNKKYVLDLARCQFIESRTNLVITGSPGVGKTHLAIAFGREACQRGYAVKFFTASRLVNTYIEARQERMILKLEKTIRRRDLVIVDKLGYLPLDRMGAEHLFGFFSQCYEQTSLIVTTNLPFAD